MAGQDMLDDGQSQSGAAGFARTTAIDPVEAFGQARQVLCGNADAGIGHDKLAATLMDSPDQIDFAARRGIAYGVSCQIAEGAATRWHSPPVAMAYQSSG